MVVAAEDITDLKRSEQLLQQQQAELDETIAELERSNAELEQFAYVASHDLREPLRMVSSYLELLERRHGETLPEDAMEFLQFALDGSKRLQRMINDLLAYSQVSREFDDVEPVDFETVVERAKENLTVSVDRTGAEITSDDLPTVEGSETLLVQLLQNLLNNAINYSEGTPRVHVSVERRDDEWRFAVEDEGVGLDPEEGERIFTLFYGNSVDGAGIGLAICQKIVELHDGRIWVESTPGEGSTFYFTLPCG
ncbi:His Kinase A (phospho-acceptor) domain-containing protein [Halogranum amylolyticum]|uniref:histidine kinase n=1 Tax=Halogranum amylolyticum TaxID=660520 RepID=A0A1H8SFP5_9EURY|nr:ATP-binding protein [Halogranum amylolyticum]SEO77482.1 His Kinase A (phospho-acceptor) domain-containing protein [Halogranum amylolyticum]